jgi:hypothetical protein
MSTRVLSFVLVAASLAGFSPDAPAQAVASGESSMLRPPPVSDQGYSREVGAEKHSNYFRLGLTFRTAYIDNLYAGFSSNGTSNGAISETIYSIYPTIAFDQTTSRRNLTVTYSPGFTFYHPSSALNETDQSANGEFSLRVTPHVAIHAADSFLKTSTSFSPTFAIPGGSTSDSALPSTLIVVPFAQLLSNRADGSLAYQFRPTGMIGISGTLVNLHYPDLKQVPGLYDSAERSGGFFYSHRIADTQYIGANYRYARIVETPSGGQFETQTQTVYFFYTIYLEKHLSLSVSGGPQYYQTTQSSTVISNSPASALTPSRGWQANQMRLDEPEQAASDQVSLPNGNSWTPAYAASMDWQRPHTNFVVSYAKTVTSGGGVLGTFNSDIALAAVRWQVLRKWTIDANVNYSIIKATDPFLVSSTQGGHTIAGAVAIEHPLSEHFNTAVEYDHLHQSYGGIPVISADPDSNRISGSISWHFGRPLGGR